MYVCMCECMYVYVCEEKTKKALPSLAKVVHTVHVL